MYLFFVTLLIFGRMFYDPVSFLMDERIDKGTGTTIGSTHDDLSVRTDLNCNWDDKDEKEVMLGIYEAEQYHPQAPYRYRDNFEKFQKDWTSGEYDPGMTFTFKDSEVEVLEVLQEEVDNIDHEAVKKQVAAAEDAKFQKHRKQRQRRKQSASKGSRYQKKFY